MSDGMFGNKRVHIKCDVVFATFAECIKEIYFKKKRKRKSMKSNTHDTYDQAYTDMHTEFW